MPRTADHDARRAHIADALNRIAGRAGLRAVTMRSVASEAGVSVRVVQYYFGDKAGLLRCAVEQLEAESARRWAARLEALGDPPPARAFLEAFLDEALPDDAPSRAFSRAFLAYTDLALDEADMSVGGPDRLEAAIAAALARAAAAGELRPGVDDFATEAATLLLLSHGLGTSVLVGQRAPAAARAIWGHHLDRLFVPTGG